MPKMNITIEAEEEKRGVDDNYMEDIIINIEQDEEYEEKLKFEIGDKKIFIDKTDLKFLLDKFN